MSYLLLVLFFILTITTGILFWQLHRHKTALASALEHDRSSHIEHDPEMVITVKLTDPIALAKRESKSARLIADYLPATVVKMVYQEVMSELEKELAERDIGALMTIEYR